MARSAAVICFKSLENSLFVYFWLKFGFSSEDASRGQSQMGSSGSKWQKGQAVIFYLFSPEQKRVSSKYDLDRIQTAGPESHISSAIAVPLVGSSRVADCSCRSLREILDVRPMALYKMMRRLVL